MGVAFLYSRPDKTWEELLASEEKDNRFKEMKDEKEDTNHTKNKESHYKEWESNDVKYAFSKCL